MKQLPNSIHLLIGLACLAIAIAGLKLMSPILSPVLLALFVVLIGYPIMMWLQRRGVPYWLAYTLVVLGAIAVVLTFVIFLAISLQQLSNALPVYRDLIDERMAGFNQLLATYNIQIETIFQLEWFNPENILQLLLAAIGYLLSALSDIGFTLLVFIYMLASAPSFALRLQHGLADNGPLLHRFSIFGQSISTYLLIKSWLGLMTALGQVILMWILGVDFTILWGLLSFLFNFVPNIGFYIALIPAVIVAFIKLGWIKAIVLAVGYTAINNAFDILVAPRYLGKGLDLSIAVTFLAVVVWAWILGPIGAFLALPLTVMVKELLLETFPETQLLALLLSAGTRNNSLGKSTATEISESN